MLIGVKLALPRLAIRDFARMSIKLRQFSFFWFKTLEVRTIQIVIIKDDETNAVHDEKLLQGGPTILQKKSNGSS